MASANDPRALQSGFIRHLFRFVAYVDRNNCLVEVRPDAVEEMKGKLGLGSDAPLATVLEHSMNLMRGAAGNRFFISKFTNNSGSVIARAAPSAKGKPPTKT